MLESASNMPASNIILASASPRRSELLSLLNLPFKRCPSDVDETRLEGESPLAYVRRLALEKGLALQPQEDEWILSADTVVDLDGEVLGKPANGEEAHQTLLALRGREHRVYTALCWQAGTQNALKQLICETIVPMREYTEDELNAYINTGDYLDKAGGYGIQHPGFHPADTVKGCYANVMGLPLCHVSCLLAKAGVEIAVNVPQLCQQHLGIECRYYPQVNCDNLDNGVAE